jgi:hypothetical protein
LLAEQRITVRKHHHRKDAMRLRMLPLAPVLAVAALGLTANAASAATLFTTTAHTARVSVGTAASISTTSWRLTSGTSGATVEACSAATFSLTVAQNNDNKIIAAVGHAGPTTFSGCAPYPSLTSTFSGTSSTWTFTINGNGTVSGTRTQWTAALHNFSYDFGGGNYRGNFANLTAWQPTASPSPVCIEFASAGSIVGPLTGDGRVDATFCFEGSAAAWSLTN